MIKQNEWWCCWFRKFLSTHSFDQLLGWWVVIMLKCKSFIFLLKIIYVCYCYRYFLVWYSPQFGVLVDQPPFSWSNIKMKQNTKLCFLMSHSAWISYLLGPPEVEVPMFFMSYWMEHKLKLNNSHVFCEILKRLYFWNSSLINGSWWIIDHILELLVWDIQFVSWPYIHGSWVPSLCLLLA